VTLAPANRDRVNTAALIAGTVETRIAASSRSSTCKPA